MSDLPTRYFIDLTQPEIAAQLQRNPLVVFPAGSVEQHGPHLPTGTDIFAANVIAHAVAERLDGLVLPGGALGVTPMHAPFAGTITLTPEVYMQVVRETCASTARHGARRCLILNWHEGNIPSLSIAADALHRDHGMTVVTVQACYVAADLYGDECGGLSHGGEIEALAILAHRPELVHLERIDDASDAEHGGAMDRFAPYAHVPAGIDRYSFHRADRLVWRSATRHGGESPAPGERHRRRHRRGGGGDFHSARCGPGR